jgi:hypothetical protein
VASEAVVLDPGLGFAKTAEQSLLVLDQLASFVALGHPVMVGPSRKRFLGVATGSPVADRDRATAAACVVAYQRGARLFGSTMSPWRAQRWRWLRRCRVPDYVSPPTLSPQFMTTGNSERPPYLLALLAFALVCWDMS